MQEDLDRGAGKCPTHGMKVGKVCRSEVKNALSMVLLDTLLTDLNRFHLARQSRERISCE
jgi:hypothetical protein